MSEEQEQQQSPSMDQLMQLVHQQGQQIAALSEQLSASNEKYDNIAESMQYQEPIDNSIPDASEEELESMTNFQLVGHLENRLGQAIQNAVGAAMEPVSNDLAATQQFMQNNNVNSEINSMAQRYPDFQPLANEIDNVIEERAQNGYNISMEDAYQIARANNPDTVAQVQKDNTPAQPNLAGGLLPTSRMIGEQAVAQDLDFDNALDKAFKEEISDQGLTNLFDESGISVVETPNQ